MQLSVSDAGAGRCVWPGTGVSADDLESGGVKSFRAAYLVTRRGNLFDLSGMRDYASSKPGHGRGDSELVQNDG
jgi:hypothetical protein